MKFLFLAFLIQSGSLFAQSGDELPAISANNKDFFIPADICKKYSLEPGQADEIMKVYNNMATDGAIQRVNDIRWQGKDKAEASQWYKANLAMLSEGADDITSELSKPAGVNSWNVYRQSKQMKDMMKSLGVDQNHYNFTFTVDQYVAKIFIATSGTQSLKDAWQLAKEGLKATLKASGKKSEADLVL
jgi:hypothetical protein